MNTDKIVVGLITRPFGIKGWLKVKSYTDPIDAILQYSPWWVSQNQKLVSIEEFDIKSHQEGFILKLPGCDDPDAARAWMGCQIEVMTDQLPPLQDDEYYWYQLVGLKVLTMDHEQLGTVDHLLETGANDVLVVKPSEQSIDQRERLIPYLLDQVVKSVDLNEQKMVVDWDKDF